MHPHYDPPVAGVPKVDSRLSFEVHPTTRTIFQHDGPHHLGFWLNGISSNVMALTTSGCG